MRCTEFGNGGETVDHLLVASSNQETRQRLQAHVAGSGVRFELSPLGVKVLNDDRQNWRAALAKLGEGLPELHRSRTRVAIVARGGDALAQQQRALLDAIALEAALDQLKHDWLFDVLRRNNALTVHLQPLASFPPAKLYGYECLLRGVAEDGSIISPGKLIEAARRVDGITQLDERARVAAVRKVGQLGLRDEQIFINFAPTAVEDPAVSLRSTIEAIIDAGIEPNRVTFEVVETERVADRNHLACVLDFFRDQGFKIALDDVGAGYSSLLAVVELLPDYIKIDGELLRRAASSRLEAKIVRDLTDAAHQHGIVSVAEGVETAEQMYFALDCGIPILQGYFLARPSAEPLNRAQVEALVQRIEGPDLAIQAA